MAQICEQCGKKIGVFSNDYISIGNYRVLCYGCAEPIKSDLTRLYSARTLMECRECKKRIIENSECNFNENVLLSIKKYIDEINPVKDDDFEQIERERIERERIERERIERERIERERIECKRIEKERINRERIQQEYNYKIANLNIIGLDGYYEYKVISLLDESGLFRKNSGKVDTFAMTEKLNELGLEGWHLVSAYSNELGKNALSGGAGGAMFGVNSTVDENILIFERFVRISKE